MNHIKNIVHQIVKTSSPQQNWKNNIFQNWNDIIGSLASHVFIERIYQDTIILAVTDSCWMQELHLLSELIKTKINGHLSEPRIKTIRLKYATKKAVGTPKTATVIVKPYIPKQLTSEETSALAKINDEELSQALTGFLQKCHHFS